MKRNNDEKLSDIVMGKAILELLDGDETLSLPNLIAKLRVMIETEERQDRRQACESAIALIINSMADAYQSVKSDDYSLLQGALSSEDLVSPGGHKLH